MLTKKSTAIRALVAARKLTYACEHYGTGRILIAALLCISSFNISSQTISTVVGTGASGYSGDGGLASAAELKLPFAVTLDVAGNIYICDYENKRIRKVTLSTGIITTIAGTGTAGYNGDGIAATSAEVNLPEGIVVDTAGNVYISDYNNKRIRKITVSTGIITTIAGTGTQGYSGDNGPATSAKINSAQGLVLDAAGNIYIADAGNNRIRKITISTGIITTIAGTGAAGYSGDGSAANLAKLSFPTGLAMDGAGNIYIADQNNSHIRKITASTGIITSIAGAGAGGFASAGYNGDNIAATTAKLSYPQEVALDAAGNVYIADVSNSRVRKITVATGIITTVAGTGTAGYNGDGIAATSAELYDVDGIAFDTVGNMYIDDGENNRIRKVTFVPVPSLWNGSSSSANWDTVANWTNRNIPADCSSNVTIPAGTPTPVITRALSVGSLTLQNNIQINSGASLSICGNVTGGYTSVSTIVGTPAQVILNGSLQQNISGKISFQNLQVNNTNGANITSGAAVNIYGALDLLTGNMVNTSGGTVIFKTSGVSSYSYLKNFGGSNGIFVGNITAELRVPVTGDNQHYIGAPVNQNSIAAFGASGVSGYVLPFYIRSLCDESISANASPYGTVFTWDETKALSAPGGPCPLYGWYCQTNNSDSIQIGKGYSVYLNGGTFSISGEPNQNSSYTIGALANSGYSLGTVEHPSPNSYSSGWQLLANPYLAPLDIVDNMLASPNSGLFDDAAVWVTSGPFEGTYQSLVANGFNGGMVSPFQGVMVHRGNGGSASATQTAANFVFNKSNLATPASLPQFTRQASASALSITISGNGFQDITNIEFNTATSTGFDIGYDSHKIVSKAGQPTIATLQNGENLSYNCNPSIEAMPDIPLTVEAGTNGRYTFTFNGIISFDPTTYIFLEDRQTGTSYNIRNGSFTFTAKTTDNPHRFALHVTPPAELQTANATCAGLGTLTINQPGEAQWAYTVQDDAQAVISTGILDAANPIAIDVSGGIYSIILQDSSGYTVEKNIEIPGGQPITAEFETSVITAEEHEVILFNSTSKDATTYSWDFGDNFSAKGQAVDHSYSSEGVYTVTLSVSNSTGCNSTMSHTVTVFPRSVTGINEIEDNNIKIWSNGNKVYVALGQTGTGATVELYNIIGQLISNEDVTSVLYARELTQQANGYFIVKVKTANGLVMKKVFVSHQ